MMKTEVKVKKVAVSNAIKEEIANGNKDEALILSAVQSRIAKKEVRVMKSEDKMKKMISWYVAHA